MAKRTPKLKVVRMAVERVDRIDPDDEKKQVVRIESVPLSPKIDPAEFLAGVSRAEDEKSPAEEKEVLSWWDVRKEQAKTEALSSFRRRLKLPKDQAVVEGMVFWVAMRGRKVEHVFHATQAARALSQELYSRLLEGTSSKAD